MAMLIFIALISVPDYTFDLIYTLVVQVDTVVKQMLSCN